VNVVVNFLFFCSFCSWLYEGAIYLGSMLISITVSFEISHPFADDTLIMCDANLDQILNLDHILVF
jgi:hypothetical protein